MQSLNLKPSQQVQRKIARLEFECKRRKCTVPQLMFRWQITLFDYLEPLTPKQMILKNRRYNNNVKL